MGYGAGIQPGYGAGRGVGFGAGAQGRFGAGPASGFGAGYEASSWSPLSLGPSSWPGVVIARDSVLYVQTGDATAESVAANQPAIETREGIAGLWTHPSFTNAAPADLTTWSALGAPTITPNYSTAPDGTATSIRLLDNDAGVFQGVYKTPAQGHRSLWARDDATLPPTITDSAALSCDATGGETYGVRIPTGNAWKRIELHAELGNQSVVAIYPTGEESWAANAVPTGGLNVWGIQYVVGFVDQFLPTGVNEAANPACTASVTGAALARAINGGGFDIQHEFIPTWYSQVSGYPGDFTLWSMSAGAHSLRYDSTTHTWILKVGGADVLTAAVYLNAQMMDRSQLVSIRAWWDVGAGAAGIRIAVGGSLQYDVTDATSGGALAAATDFYLGSDAGSTGITPLRHHRVTIRATGGSKAETILGCALGDSVISGSDYPAVPGLVRTPSETAARSITRNTSYPGHTIANQKTAWQALSAAERLAYSWVVVQVGLNDLNPAEAASVAIARLQDLIDTINADTSASCKVLIGSLSPCKQRLIDVYGATDGATAYTKWQDMNTAIGGGGGSPITGVDGRITSHATDMNDGAGNLLTAYDSGDGIHPKTNGRVVNAAAWRAGLIAAGATP